MSGLHLLVDAWVRAEAACAPVMSQADLLRQVCLSAVASAGLTIVGDAFHQFPPRQQTHGGVTGTVLLAESHLAIHTWPELGFVSLDLYVCNRSADQGALVERVLAMLKDALGVDRSEEQRISRSV